MALYIQSGVVTPFMFDVYSFMYGLDPLWCKQGHHHSFRGPKKSALSVIQFVVSCRLTFRIFPFECDFFCDVFICSASHLPLPSHTTHSVGLQILATNRDPDISGGRPSFKVSLRSEYVHGP